ncbi:coiled-coil domain-containing protein 97-like [Salmo trutta]|uniref:coiled-coil domain-containing protein 97-like n=1 Tax=Salmo trutta TaxID=8032 RepID=UPI001131EA79|nr:coiled-coil domain-containing protein 97-like [Salmo trutta]
MWGEIDPGPESSPPVSDEPVACRQPDPRGPQPDPRRPRPDPRRPRPDPQPGPRGTEPASSCSATANTEEDEPQENQADPSGYYCREVRRRAAGRSNRTRVRNQRYAALRELQREGQYFSEDQMRSREPLLYEQYIGQYLTEEQLLHCSLEAMQGGAGEERGPGGAEGGLAHLLLNSYQERLIQSRLQEEQDREEEALEEEEGEEEAGGLGAEGYEPTPQEKALLRDEFITLMYQRFLDGHDKDFNYSEVDGNPTTTTWTSSTEMQRRSTSMRMMRRRKRRMRRRRRR